MNNTVPPKRIFPTSKVDAHAASHVPATSQTESKAYKLAFQDTDFLLREDLRPVRFQLELLKPELLLDEAKIASTFVFNGSARIPAPEMADAVVAAATSDRRRSASTLCSLTSRCRTPMSRPTSASSSTISHCARCTSCCGHAPLP